jgi:glyoxylase-like metal-dependent hydrolase (beta-lactamase superfamily II)
MLHRWTAHHEKWGKDVACIAVESPDGLLHFDPLDQTSEADHTFVTTFFHARSARGRVWAPKDQVRRLGNRGVEVTDPFEPGDELPGGVECFGTARSGEVLYWIPSEGSLWVGDVLLGSPFRLCPKSWMTNATIDDLKESLAPLLDLPVERIYLAHGDPVLDDAHARLAALL